MRAVCSKPAPSIVRQPPILGRPRSRTRCTSIVWYMRTVCTGRSGAIRSSTSTSLSPLTNCPSRQCRVVAPREAAKVAVRQNRSAISSSERALLATEPASKWVSSLANVPGGLALRILLYAVVARVTPDELEASRVGRAGVEGRRRHVYGVVRHGLVHLGHCREATLLQGPGHHAGAVHPLAVGHPACLFGHQLTDLVDACGRLEVRRDECSPAAKQCICESMSPGRTVAPWRSSLRVDSVARAKASRSPPTKAMRPSLTATALCRLLGTPMVITLALTLSCP